MIILINWIFVLFVLSIFIIVRGRVITKIVKTKYHETMKPTERLKNQPTKKPYSPQVSRKTTTFYLHEISWQKQLKKAISNWTFGCDAPQKIGKTAVMECKRNCKRKTTYEYNACTLLAFIFFIIINIRKFRQLKSLILDEGQTGQLVQDLVFDSWCPYGFLKKVEDKHFLMNWLFGGR